MPVNTSFYDFTMARNNIIRRAFRVLGKLPRGEQLSSYSLNSGVEALNAMVKHWQNDHIYLWTLQTQTLNTEIGKFKYDLSALNFISLDKAYIRQSGTDCLLEQTTFREYQDNFRKSNVGRPLTFSYDLGIAPSMYLFPVPEAVYSITLLGEKKLEDFDQASDVPNFPAGWINALVYGLIARLCDEVGVPLGERVYLKKKAQKLKGRARKSDREYVDMRIKKGAYSRG